MNWNIRDILLRTSEICGKFFDILRQGFENFAKIRVKFAAKISIFARMLCGEKKKCHFIMKYSAKYCNYAALTQATNKKSWIIIKYKREFVIASN